jgi:hypothetical protein
MLEHAYDMTRTAMLHKQGIYCAVHSIKRELKLNSSSGMMNGASNALVACEVQWLQNSANS